MKTLITAHSGADGTADNSRDYLEYILKTKVDAAEIDVRDVGGVLLLTHNPVEAGALTGGQVPLSDLTIRHNVSHEKSDSVPDPLSDAAVTIEPSLSHPLITLREAFEMLHAAPAAMRYNCDLKEDGLEGKVYALAKETGVADRILYSGSVSIDRMREAGILGKVEVYLNIEEIVPEVKAAGKRFLASLGMTNENSEVTEGGKGLTGGRVPLSDLAIQHNVSPEKSDSVPDPLSDDNRIVPLSPETSGMAKLAERACAIAKDAGIAVLNVNKLLVTQEFYRICSEEGIGLSVWTVDAGEEAARFLEMGVHSVTTREVREVIRMRALRQAQ